MTIEVKPADLPPGGIQYYWCVNCGNYGRFEFARMKQCNCQVCNYDALTAYDLEEINADPHLVDRFKDVIK